jgi:shikimate dehydrogenase
MPHSDYTAIEVTESELPAFIDGLDATWVGLSLTMPLKEAVIPLLDRVSETVALSGAANTVVFDDGRRIGHNTDVPGAMRTIRELGLDEVGAATLIGGGATARSMLVALTRLGALAVTLVVRRPDAVGGATALADRLGLRHVVVGFEDAAVTDALAAPLVISTVPGGAADGLVTRLPHERGPLVDVAYSPWPTGLAAAWQAGGTPVASGFDLLLWQAAEQVELMTGRSAPIEQMRMSLAAHT